MEVSEEHRELNVLALNETEPPRNSIKCGLRTALDWKPRTPPLIYELPPDVRPKTPWGIPISLFRDYKFDDQAHLAECFEFDWKCSKLLRVVKNLDEQAAVKEVLRNNYGAIREAYKYYAAVGCSGGIFSVGVNAFTDLWANCRLIDGSVFKLADIDFNMKATCYNEIKNNPRNPGTALVRFEFMEIIVRIAMDKYYKSGH
jgi:hypothetical protein